MPHYDRHVFICTNRRAPGHAKGSCADKGSEQLVNLFKAELHRRGLKPVMRANAAGCLGQCQHGPTIVVYPEGVWYRVVTPEDVQEIIETHLVGGQVVARLQLPPDPAS